MSVLPIRTTQSPSRKLSSSAALAVLEDAASANARTKIRITEILLEYSSPSTSGHRENPRPAQWSKVVIGFRQFVAARNSRFPNGRRKQPGGPPPLSPFSDGVPDRASRFRTAQAS